MPSAHAAVKHELLVRYLDAWTPTALHRHKRVTYVDLSPDGSSAAAALRVFSEFADLLDRHTLTMIVGQPLAESADRPAGLEVVPVRSADELVRALPRTPTFGWFDGVPPPARFFAAAGVEVMMVSPPDSTATVGDLLACRVELVDRDGEAELLTFATGSEKALEKFKDELWALDEYAGIRLRDPHDEERTLLDISVQPQLGPLRRALLSHVADTGGSTVAELRSWAVRSTVFRAVDATKAVQNLVSSGAVCRTPLGGRLAPTTLIQPS
jgi:hypothetical protein